MDFEWLSSLSLYTRVSIWFTLVPVALCIPVLSRMPAARLMLLLFVTGLFTELSSQKAGAGSSYSHYIFLFYSVVECTIFLSIAWFRESCWKSRSLMISLLASTILAVISLSILRTSQWAIAIFNMVYQIIIAVMCGRNLLRRIESGLNASSHAMFGLQLGIFFYCFTTFFLMGVIGVSAMYKLWDPYHNTINIITYIVYACSFWFALRDTRSGLTV